MTRTDAAQATPATQAARALSVDIALLAAAAVAGMLVLIALRSEVLVLAVYFPALHQVVDTLTLCIAAAVSTLLVARARRRGVLGDQLLGEGFGIIAVTLALGLVVELASIDGLVWVQIVGRWLFSWWVLIGVLLPLRPRGTTHRLRVCALAVALAIGLVVSPRLGEAVVVQVTDSVSVSLAGARPVVVFQVISAILVLVAAVVCARRADELDDPLLRWMAPALVLAALARVAYAGAPTIYTGWFYVGDLLRAGCYALILVGAALEVRAYWHGIPRSEVEQERRRIARELHDGVVQELALMRQLAPENRLEVAHIDRAMDEARSAIDDLAMPGADVAELVERAVARIGHRHGIAVETSLRPLPLEASARHHVVRLAQEATTNACRHSGGARVRVELDDDGARVGGGRLRVVDNGIGMTDAATPDGYGLIAMRERAGLLGGRLTVREAPGGGTEVEVTW